MRVRHLDYGEGVLIEAGDLVRVRFGTGAASFVKMLRGHSA
jgi:hypothetical protein